MVIRKLQGYGGSPFLLRSSYRLRNVYVDFSPNICPAQILFLPLPTA